jgi:hypothetical protein
MKFDGARVWVLSVRNGSWQTRSTHGYVDLSLSTVVLKFAIQRQSLGNEKLAAFRKYGTDATPHIQVPSLVSDPGAGLKLPMLSNMKQAAAEKIAQHLLSQDLEDLRKAKVQGTTRFFADLCDALNLDRTGVDLQQRSAKTALFDLITNSVCARLLTFGFRCT